MSSYTKYHKAYEMRNRDQINLRKRKRHCFATYGIPILEYDDLIDELKEHRKYYIKLRDLDPKLLKYVIEKFHGDKK